MELELNVPTEAEKAWMAGFLDGEGCIGVYRSRGHFTSNIKIGNCDIRPLEIFVLSYGGVLWIRKESKIKNFRSQWQWTCPHPESKRFLVDMLPFLRSKKEQADTVLEFLELVMPHGGKGPSRTPSKENIFKREELYTKTKKLNKSGLA